MITRKAKFHLHMLYKTPKTDDLHTRNSSGSLQNIDQYLMSPEHSNKALAEDGGFAQNKYR